MGKLSQKKMTIPTGNCRGKETYYKAIQSDLNQGEFFMWEYHWRRYHGRDEFLVCVYLYRW